jgi:hypothetical protein
MIIEQQFKASAAQKTRKYQALKVADEGES